MAKSFRSPILQKILSHRRERRKISSQNTTGDCIHILWKMRELTKSHRSRLSCSLGTGVTPRTKTLSRNAGCRELPPMSWPDRSVLLTTKGSSPGKVKHYTYRQPQQRKEQGLRTDTCPQHLLSAPGNSTTALLGNILLLGFQAQR